MGLTGFGGSIGDALKKTCTDKTTLSNFFKDSPEAEYGVFTPGDPRTVCTGELLSSDELKKHKDNFCSLKPEHSVCPTTPSSPTSTPSSPTSTPSGPTSSSSQNGTSNNDSVMLLCSVISCFSCIISIILAVVMMKKS